MRRLSGFVIACGFFSAIPGWLWFAGSYSPNRDYIGIAGVTIIVFLVFAMRAERKADGVRGAIAAMLRPSGAIAWALACWIALSAMDRLFAPPPVPLNRPVIAKSEILADLKGKRISLALSGGGYRATLLHAGVIMQLSELGVPISNIASVSGGSIIGAFLAAGGDPGDFVEAVRDGRFRLKRELTSAFELPRWILPFTGYSRRDVQASMLRRTLLPASIAPGRGPELMIAMTDLAHVMSVGKTRTGFMFAGPTTSKFFRSGSAIEVDGLGDLSDVVATSGAFPGAFPANRVSARYSRHGFEPLGGPDTVRIELTLSDGGVRDNLGLKLLEEADAHARGTAHTASERPSVKPGPEWAQDMIIVADGGAAMSVESDVDGPIGEALRAIDIASLETGVIRLVDTSRRPPKRLLSLPGLVAPFPDSSLIFTPDQEQAAQRYFFFRPSSYDRETLQSIAKLSADPRAEGALTDYLAVDHPAVRAADIEQTCRQASTADSKSAGCTWWRLVTAVGSDIEAAAEVFRSSGTLRDDYSTVEVDALVRLGRYFVLLDWPKLNACLRAVAHDAPDRGVTCVM